MTTNQAAIIRAYNPNAALADAATIPSAWYTDAGIHELERRRVFSRSWQFVGHAGQVEQPGQFVTADIADEPIVVVRGGDGVLRGFYNVCRHHAAAIATAPQGRCHALRCPYHGWTYALDGTLKGTPEFAGVNNFDRAANGLVPVPVETWEQFVFVCLDDAAPTLREWLGGLVEHVGERSIGNLAFLERRVYDLNCNWKVFVDNYLDGGYHVPHVHKGLGSVLDYARYTIENFERFCVQSSPIDSSGGDAETAAVRRGDMAYYYWLYPNFMLNWYEGVMDLNIVLPLGIDRTRVLFDFYFDQAGDATAARNRASIAVAERVQQEDIDICESVQRGLRSRAYDVGRLSVRREAGEHLFHRLLHADLSRGT